MTTADTARPGTPIVQVRVERATCSVCLLQHDRWFRTDGAAVVCRNCFEGVCFICKRTRWVPLSYFCADCAIEWAGSEESARDPRSRAEFVDAVAHFIGRRTYERAREATP